MSWASSPTRPSVCWRVRRRASDQTEVSTRTFTLVGAVSCSRTLGRTRPCRRASEREPACGGGCTPRGPRLRWPSSSDARLRAGPLPAGGRRSPGWSACVTSYTASTPDSRPTTRSSRPSACQARFRAESPNLWSTPARCSSAIAFVIAGFVRLVAATATGTVTTGWAGRIYAARPNQRRRDRGRTTDRCARKDPLRLRLEPGTVPGADTRGDPRGGARPQLRPGSWVAAALLARGCAGLRKGRGGGDRRIRDALARGAPARVQPGCRRSGARSDVRIGRGAVGAPRGLRVALPAPATARI